VAAVLAGAALGMGARLVMRLVALTARLPGSFSAGGSLEVVAVGVLLGAPLALAFFAVRRRVHVGPPWAGALFGLALFAVEALIPLPAARTALAATPDPPLITAALFAGLFVLFGMGLDLRWRRWHRRSQLRR
jgi:hypothetical protein